MASSGHQQLSEASDAHNGRSTASELTPEVRPGSQSELVQELSARVMMLEARVGDGTPRRQVSLTTRSVLEILGLIVGLVALVAFLSVAWGAITLVLISVLAALALNPGVEFFVRRGLRRGLAAAVVFVIAALAVALLGLLLIPPLISQVDHFIKVLPADLNQVSRGHGPLGFLERKFHVVQEANKLLSSKSLGSTAAGVAGSGIGVALSVAGTVIGLVVIAFMTFFMLLEGPSWLDRFFSLLPEGVEPRYRRIGAGVARTVTGFVTGNLAASVLAGAISAVVLFAAGISYPVPLGVLVGFLDLLPIFGAFVAIAIVAAVSFSHSLVTGFIVTGIVFAYHQVEVYYLRPVIYGQMIKLSPLAVLVAATIGTEVAGPLGAIAAIPVGGAVQLIVDEALDARRQYRARSEADDEVDRTKNDENQAARAIASS